MKILKNKLFIAKLLCLYYHRGQKDKTGKPYYKHPMFVASRCVSKEAKIVATCHDLLEDTDCKLSTLYFWFSPHIVWAIFGLTKPESFSYMEYINNIKNLCGNVAIEVKINDLIHNSMLSRYKNISDIDEKVLSRTKRYLKALEVLIK